MEVKVIKYTPDPYGDFKLGWAYTNLSGKQFLNIGVFKNRQGGTFCLLPTIKILGTYAPAVDFPDAVKFTILKEVEVQVKVLIAQLEKAPQAQAPVEKKFDDSDCPF